MDLSDHVDAIAQRDDLVSFVRTLASSLDEEPDRWENCDLPSYLAALAAWLEDMDGYYENRGEAPPQQPGWRTLGEALLAARIYE